MRGEGEADMGRVPALHCMEWAPHRHCLMTPGLTEAPCAGSGRSFTAYVFNRRGFVPPAVRQLAAGEQACLDALQPPTPLGVREAHMDLASSQASAELEAADELAWCAPSLWVWKQEPHASIPAAGAQGGTYCFSATASGVPGWLHSQKQIDTRIQTVQDCSRPCETVTGHPDSPTQFPR